MARRCSFVLAFAVTLLGAGLRSWGRFGDTSLRLTFFDVGQGDAALVEFPGGESWLVDGGGGEPGRDRGKRVLFPELTRLGVLRVREAVLSHPHQDHAQGFDGLFGEIAVDRFVFGSGFLGERGLMDRLRRKARNAGVEAVLVENEKGVPIPGGSARFLALNVGRTVHDRSLLLELRFGGCVALFPGDAEAEGEKEWVRRNPGTRIDLLKVPHHGSLTSSTPEFLDSISPRWAVVSVGLGNGYGHPKARVLERYRERGISVLRTDFHGFVRFRISPDGRVGCETALGPCGEARCQPSSS